MTGTSSNRPGSAGFRLALSGVGAIASQAVVVTAVLYYFGLIYTRTWYAHFGVDAGMLGYTTPDYVLRSVGGAYWPAVMALLGVLALFGLRGVPLAVAVRLRRPRRVLRVWAATVLVTGALLEGAVAAGIVLRDGLPSVMSLYLPVMLVIGVALIGYAIALRTAYPSLLGIRARSASATRAMWFPIMVLLVLGFLGTLWGVGSYAEHRGARDAETMEADSFSARPVVLLLSVDRLGIEGGGSRVDEITVPGEKYRYVYSGLLLFARTPDRYFLVPHQWKAKRDRVFVVGVSDSIRIDLAEHP
ncbi:hypothetical protein [Nocardia arizonensis]|uniref:hypothetical protein n=1 Tax=Nocardia arizonensis TaxID=1141647 RepID=UPI000AF6029D|nr:hypothetical protein [Nocardia arizonensis]